MSKKKIKDITSFNKIFQYILETEGREFSATNIIEYLKKENSTISTQTLYQYLEALQGAFILNKVYRYDVYTGKTTKGKIDMVAIKDGITKYIQVTYKLDNNEKNIESEVGTFNSIDDNYDKYVISLDKIDFSKNGIKNINIFDFLLDENF